MRSIWLAIMVVLSVSPLSAATLFQENFEDTAFTSRGWYDSPRATLSSQEHVAGSTRCFECLFRQGATGCAGGTPGRHQFAESETVLLSYWVKYSANYVGSGKPYHPHEFHFVTNKDDRWVGPSFTHLTTYTEQNGGTVRIALQDGRNNDTNCILLNNNSFVRCNGSYATYKFTEARSVCSCNGLVGDLGGRDCFNQGDGTYYSARFWDSPGRMFTEQAGPHYKNDWHFVECYFQMNTISNGIAVPDGVIQYWYDGSLILDYHHILFRTATYPDMKFNQFLIAPYIGDGSPVDQYMWVDNLTVSTARSSSNISGFRSSGYAVCSIPNIHVLSQSRMSITLPDAGPYLVRIVDASGRIILNANLDYRGPNSEIDLPSTLPNRLLCVSVYQQGRLMTEKLVIPR